MKSIVSGITSLFRTKQPSTILDEKTPTTLDKKEQPSSKYVSTCTVHWVRHAESCSNIVGNISYDKIMHPPITPLGLAQSIKLGYHLRGEVYSAYYSSPSLRTIMTAIFSLRMVHNIDLVTLIIMPWISENLNNADTLSDVARYINLPVDTKSSWDRQNSLPHPNNLKKIVIKMKEWINTTYNNEYFDLHLYNLFEKIIELFKLIFQTYLFEGPILRFQSSLSELESLNRSIRHNSSNNIIFPNNLTRTEDTVTLGDTDDEDQSDGVFVNQMIFKDLIVKCKTLLTALENHNNQQHNANNTVAQIDTQAEEKKDTQAEEKKDTPNGQYYGMPSFLQSRQLFNQKLLTQINEILNQIEISDTNKFLNGPNIDFTYYEQEYKKIFSPERTQIIKPDDKKYHNTFLVYINKRYAPSQQIIVFTHGGTIENLLGIRHPNNTSIYKSFQATKPELIYCPEAGLIYSTKHCDINGKKYNGELIENNVKHNNCNKENPMGKLFNTVDGIFKEEIKDDNNKKYLKYKNKYINLKNKLSLVSYKNI